MLQNPIKVEEEDDVPLAFEAPRHKPKSKVLAIAIAAVFALAGLAAFVAVVRKTACSQVQQGPPVPEGGFDHPGGNFDTAATADFSLEGEPRVFQVVQDPMFPPPPFCTAVAFDFAVVGTAASINYRDDLDGALPAAQITPVDLPVAPLPDAVLALDAILAETAAVGTYLKRGSQPLQLTQCGLIPPPPSAIEVTSNTTWMHVPSPQPVCYMSEKPPGTTAAPLVSFGFIQDFAAWMQSRVFPLVIIMIQGLWYLIVHVVQWVKIIGSVVGVLVWTFLRMLMVVGRFAAQVLVLCAPGLL